MPILGPGSLPTSLPFIPAVDVEKVVRDYLVSVLPGMYEVGLVVPEVDEIRDRLPFIQITRRGGIGLPQDRFDYPTIDISVFHANNALVNSAGAVVRGAMAACRWYFHTGENAHITEYTEAEGPQRLAWEDPDIKRLGFVAELTVRPLVS